MSSMNGTKVTWLGHSTVLVTTAKGTHILIDPFITGNPKSPKHYELPSRLPYILLTHGHGDHISDAAPVARKHHSKVVAIYELADFIARKGISETVGMNLGGTVQLDDVAVSMVDARHSAGAHDENGTHYAGVAVGYVLAIDGGPVLYHAGDTNVFGDMKLIGEIYHPEVAMLPIGGFYTMGPREAAYAVRLLGAKTVLPLHFGTFPPLVGTPKELAALVEPGVEVVDWKPGDNY